MGADAAPAGGARNPALGRSRVTVRSHYEGLPFSGLNGAGRAERKLRDRAGEEPAVRVPEATVPKPKIAAVERRKACALPQSARRAPARRIRLLRLPALRLPSPYASAV